MFERIGFNSELGVPSGKVENCILFIDFLYREE
jgi:hypothetical protein